MSGLRVLVLGLGFVGRSRLKEVSACPECEVAGVVSKHPDLLAKVGDEFKVPLARRFATIEEGLNRSGAEAVIVALPAMIHEAAIMAALERGLHVLTEKPLAMDMVEAGAIVRAARRAQGLTVMVNQNYRWRPYTLAIRRAVREGKVGRLGSASYEFRRAVTRTTTDGWRERMPHPYLHDIAVHHFDLLRACTGLDCTELMAFPVRPPWNWYEGLPAVEAILTFEQGLVAGYTGTMVARGFTSAEGKRGPSTLEAIGIMTLVGEGGTLRLEADEQVRWYGDGKVEVIPQEAMLFTDTAYTLREFLACIREKRRPETHVEDNLRSFAMVAAAIHSIEKREPVAVAPLVAEALAA